MTNQTTGTGQPTGLVFDAGSPLGTAFRIDTSSVWAEATDPERITRVSIGTLIAMEGQLPSEYLVGMLDRVTRDSEITDVFEEDDADTAVPLTRVDRDLFRVVLLGTYRTVDGKLRNTFKRGADSYPRIDAKCWAIVGTNLQTLMSLLSSDVEEEKRLYLGSFVADPSAKAVANGDQLFQRHAALVGSTGSGKSWAVALVLEKAAALQYPNLIVLDMHGEYSPLTMATEASKQLARGWRVAGPNDITESEGVLFLPYWMLTQEELLALLLDRSEDNAPNQAARFTEHVRSLKRKTLETAGKTEALDNFTVDSPIPFSLSELVELLEFDDTEMVPGARSALVGGPFKGKLTRFISRLKTKMKDRRYAFMFKSPESTSEYEWLHGLAKNMLGTSQGIKVIDFSEVPSDALPVVVGVFARVLYDIQFWSDPEQRTPFTVVCDEAHLYLPADNITARDQRALDSFERIAKEVRKYGVSLLVVSQRPSDVSKTVLSQCNNFIVLRLTNDQDRRVIERVMPDNLTGLTASLPLLDIGEAIVIGDSIVLPTRIRLDQPSVKPDSATRKFWTEWNTRPAKPETLSNAVEAMRRQSRV
ncbi:ATP-binding protein [Glutamicibacter arilaitensis]|uniref:ATP-binding protein n=1 Tax=Glutamicibacter arilaitensis TaxID=256701 RepID=UPI003F916B11